MAHASVVFDLAPLKEKAQAAAEKFLQAAEELCSALPGTVITVQVGTEVFAMRMTEELGKHLFAGDLARKAEPVDGVAVTSYVPEVPPADVAAEEPPTESSNKSKKAK